MNQIPPLTRDLHPYFAEQGLKKSKYWWRNVHRKMSTFHIFCEVYKRPCCCCLTIIPIIVGWDIMGYESEPPPNYNELRNRSYSIMLNYTDYPSTTQINLSRADPTISSSGSYPASGTPRYRVHNSTLVYSVVWNQSYVEGCRKGGGYKKF